MAFCGIGAFLAAPLLVGAPISRIFLTRNTRKKNTGWLEAYVIGLLSLFALFLFVFAVGLKLDVELDGLEKLFFVPTALLSFGGLIFLIVDRKRFMVEKLTSKKEWLWIGAAVLVAFVSIFLTIPAFCTDDTFELVRTTIKVRILYKNASLTGMISSAGVSGFVKVYIMPMFLACMCDFFKIDVSIFAVSVVQPVIIVCNLYLVRRISKYFTRNNTSFMLVYIAVLIAGTVIPKTIIPTTTGFVLLRDGYTGYSLAWGVALPAVALALIEGKYLLAVIMAASTLGLVRLENAFECIKHPVNTFQLMNLAGKLAVLYILAGMYCFLFHSERKGKKFMPLLLCGPALIATAYVDILEKISSKKNQIVLTASAIVILLACANFNTFEGANFAFNLNHLDRNAVNIVRSVEQSFAGTGKIPVVWAPDEVAGNVRIVSANVRLPYAKTEWNAMICRTNFEDSPALINSYKRLMADIVNGTQYYELSSTYDKTIESLEDLGVNTVVLPSNSTLVVTAVEKELLKKGFAKECVMGGYIIYIKK